MIKLKNTLFTAALILTTVYGFAQKDEIKSLEIGAKAPMVEYTMKGVDDANYNLSQLMGKNGLLVVFSCNTCPFVVGSENFEGWEKQYNHLNEVASKNGINMVLVNSNEGKRGDDDSPENMKKRASDMHYTMPYVIDENSQLADAFGARTTPHVYLFDEQFTLIYVGAIDNKVDGKRSKDELYLLDAIAAKSVAEKIITTSTPPRGCSIKRVKK